MTTEEIQAEIDAAFESKFGFDINATSNASDWKLWRGVTAMAIFNVRKLWEIFTSEITELAKATEFGNKRWWAAQILSFQYGDPLLESEGKLYYAINNASKQIIKRVSITEQLSNGLIIVQVKVAKLSGTDTVALSNDEKTALISYVEDKKPAGIATQVISLAADEMKTTETIYYDGKLVLSEITSLLMAARKQYLASIYFDGQFNVNKYRDALEAVSGVIDTDITTVSIKPSGGTYSAVVRTYDALSGHYKINENDCSISLIAQ